MDAEVDRGRKSVTLTQKLVNGNKRIMNTRRNEAIGEGFGNGAWRKNGGAEIRALETDTEEEIPAGVYLSFLSFYLYFQLSSSSFVFVLLLLLLL